MPSDERWSILIGERPRLRGVRSGDGVCAVKRGVNAAGESPAQGGVGTPW